MHHTRWITLTLMTCCGASFHCTRARSPSTSWPTVVVPQASGATRLLLSPSGNYLLAEIRGRWLQEEYGLGDDEYVPGVLKLLGPDREVVRSAQGWALGPPDDQGRLGILEEGPEEFRYRVRPLASPQPVVPLALPEGYWHVKAALGDPRSGCMVAVLWSPVVGHNNPDGRRDRLWLASLDRGTHTPRATRQVEATTPSATRDGRYDRGIAVGGSPAEPILAYLELPAAGAEDARWRVTALDCKTLRTRWQVHLPHPVAEPVAESPAAPRSRRLPLPPVKMPPPSADHQRMFRTGDLAFSGDGRHLAVVHGSLGRISVGVESVYALSSASGQITARIHGKATGLFNAHRLAPAPGRPAVVALDLTSVRMGAGEHVDDLYFGAWEIALAPLRVTQVIQVSRASLGERWEETRNMTPRALVVHGGQILLAPECFEWVINRKIAGPWPRGDGTGARRPEVAAWTTLPREWHRPARPAVREQRAWMNAAAVKRP